MRSTLLVRRPSGRQLVGFVLALAAILVFAKECPGPGPFPPGRAITYQSSR